MKILKNFVFKALILDLTFSSFGCFSSYDGPSSFVYASNDTENTNRRHKKKVQKRRTSSPKSTVSFSDSPNSYRIIYASKVTESFSPYAVETVVDEGEDDPRDFVTNETRAFTTPFGQLAWEDVAPFLYVQQDKTYVNYRGFKLELTLRPEVQESAEKHLTQERLLNGATVIIEPKTGKILAMAQYGGADKADFSVMARAPTASLIKIITAGAAIEKVGLEPEDALSYRGPCGKLRQTTWLADARRDGQIMTFAKAFGVSCNPVFGRIALYQVGLSGLKTYSEKFMFNRAIPSDVRLQTSIFVLPSIHTATPLEVAEAGSGFGVSRISPVHAALLASTISNDGVMMAPYLVEAAFNARGDLVYSATPRELGRALNTETAEKIKVLMQETIASGTSRMYFRRSGTRHEIAEIGGKTGTLSDPENRDVLYNWFSGIAPLSSPNNVAIGTFSASPNHWVVRASSIAQKTLANYLKLERDERKVALW